MSGWNPDEWILVVAPVQWVGKIAPRPPTGGGPLSEPLPLYLSPVYELEAFMVEAPGARRGVVHMAMPVTSLLSITGLPLPDNSVSLNVSTLSAADQGAIRGAVERVEGLVEEARAAQAGIQLARPGARLPDIVRPRGPR